MLFMIDVLGTLSDLVLMKGFIGCCLHLYLWSFPCATLPSFYWFNMFVFGSGKSIFNTIILKLYCIKLLKLRARIGFHTCKSEFQAWRRRETTHRKPLNGNMLSSARYTGRSDDVRTQILLLETIDLEFIVPHQNIRGFIFIIDGCNLYK